MITMSSRSRSPRGGVAAIAGTIGLLLTILALAGCQAVFRGMYETSRFSILPAPLPETVRIVPPNPDVPPELAAFSGKWVGRWDGELDHILVVEEVRSTHASVIYAYGAAGSWGINMPEWTRERGQFEDGGLTLSRVGPTSGIRRDATVTYRLRPDGSLEGSLRWSGGLARIRMSRTPSSRTSQ